MKRTLLMMSLALGLLSAPPQAAPADDPEAAPQSPARTTPPPRGPHHDGQHRRHMKEKLGLTDEQLEQIRQIRENGGGRDEIRAVLTEEQRALLDEQRRKMESRGQRDRSPMNERTPEDDSEQG